MPAPMASWVSRPRAWMRSASTPNSAEVELAGAGGELDHVLGAVDRLEARGAVVALDQPRDVLVEHLAAQIGPG